MSQRASATRIGAFVVGGLVLLALVIVVVAGNQLFTRKELAVMNFDGSVYGLQVGAPVVFRGVRIGSVSAIDVHYDAAGNTFTIPVRAELDRNAVRSLGGADAAAALPSLVQRGLRAQLAMQSLLTGLLYIDLDMHPERPPRLRGHDAAAVEIPTTATAIQNLKDQLENMDFKGLLDDVSAIARSARTLAAGPKLGQMLDDVTAITGNVRRLTARLDGRLGPLADDARHTLADARSAMGRLGQAGDGVRDTAQRLGRASDHADALLAPESPLVQNVQQAAAELARAAAALRLDTAADSGLLRNTDRALQDVSRAARALRELAETLDRHPEALIRGRPAEEKR
jgi:paraquat-inducible protein B